MATSGRASPGRKRTREFASPSRRERRLQSAVGVESIFAMFNFIPAIGAQNRDAEKLTVMFSAETDDGQLFLNDESGEKRGNCGLFLNCETISCFRKWLGDKGFSHDTWEYQGREIFSAGKKSPKLERFHKCCSGVWLFGWTAVFLIFGFRLRQGYGGQVVLAQS